MQNPIQPLADVSKIVAFLMLTLMFSPGVMAQQAEKTTQLFDGKSLKGWKVFPSEFTGLWTVKDGVIVGGDGTTNIAENNYLCTENAYEDFEFRCLFRLTGDHEKGMINSGIQYRSFIEGGNMVGYQADIGRGFWGDIYDEHRRAKLIGGDLSTLQHVLKEDGWNSYIVRVRGERHELYINGVKTADYIEKDASIPTKGIIGVQLHSGGNAKLELRDITITELK
ncbi:MAG TPA: DUF1080 domain-containing protein [Cyclobacteriaceae bacterium]|nr:DUF1080 domain-containing protein [Cyclobacteriaceae bacterium]